MFRRVSLSLRPDPVLTGRNQRTREPHERMSTDVSSEQNRTKGKEGKKGKETPLMRQYHQVKQKHPDSVLLFRLGDFYETFEEDAIIAAKVCGITLTKRGNGTASEIPLAGFPHHQIENYLPKLVRAGYRVAVCEQLEDPKSARGIVRRDVVEVVTPGVAMNDGLLDAATNNYLAAVAFDRDRVGVAFCDVSTGEFATTEVAAEQLAETLDGISPAEILVSKSQRDRLSGLRLGGDPRITRLEEWIFENEYGEERLREQFETKSLKGFGIDDMPVGVAAAGAAMHYLLETQRSRLGHIRRIRRYEPGDYIALDPATRRNLEITASSGGGGRFGSLIDVLDRTATPMGGRLLKKWILHPLKSVEQIEKRLGAVAALYDLPSLATELATELRATCDLERIVGRIATARATPRDLGNVRDTLLRIPRLVDLLGRTDRSGTLATIGGNLDRLDDLAGQLQEAIPEEPPASTSDGGAIRRGFSPELDELRDIRSSGKEYLAGLQQRERERTGIGSLKVGFNNVFGYYIEITNTHRDRVPEDYHRKQTLTNSERYITPELKEYEEKILNAEEKIGALERDLFQELQATVAERGDELMRNGALLAMLDCFVGFARVARENGYVRPSLEESTRLEIRGGRHPVVETLLPTGETFVPNDTTLDSEETQIAIITGPNMAGKSTMLRQVALIVLLAQIGSFVPAESARVGLVDRIFTRVGAQDNIAAGESTFLVEMHESATILNNATRQSLILLDEVGRGTSTFDGVSIAWSIAEYLHEAVGARTLFATHYHELNGLADRFERIANYKVEVREHGEKIIFLRKVLPGTADHSYGIEVAKMAGLPAEVIARARQIMERLEEGEGVEGAGADRTRIDRNAIPEREDRAAPTQISFFEAGAPDPALEALATRLRELDPNSLTPLEALAELARLRADLGGEKRG